MVSYFSIVIIGSVLRCDVTGKILMKWFLSGMPDLKLGLNDKFGLEKEAQLKARPSKRSLLLSTSILRILLFYRSCSLELLNLPVTNLCQ